QYLCLMVYRRFYRWIAVRPRPHRRLAGIEPQPVEKPLDFAVGLPCGRVSLPACTFWRPIFAFQIDCVGESLLVAVLIEESLQPPQLPNKRCFLLPDRRGAVIIRGASILRRTMRINMTHGTTPAVMRATRPRGFATAPRTADRATRAKTSSRGPNAIIR